jgi:hypothetical protein
MYEPVADTIISTFQFICRQCGKTFVHEQEHPVHVLPVFAAVECTECLTLVENSGSPDPVRRSAGLSLLPIAFRDDGLARGQGSYCVESRRLRPYRFRHVSSFTRPAWPHGPTSL